MIAEADYNTNRDQRIREAVALVARGLSVEEAAELTGVLPEDVPEERRRYAWMPTPREIERAAREIRATWDEYERQKRKGQMPDEPYCIPTGIPCPRV